MTISIDWSTRVISIPRSDLELIQSTPSYVYNMSLNWFRTQLKDQEDSPDGMLYPTTHTHNTEASLSGLTYARMIQIINNYTVTFEDGQYAVNLTGANSNVADVTNVNQVSVRPQNSAGMTSSPAIEHASFEGHVSVDVESVYYGTVYPSGSAKYPVNNLDDALLIAAQRGFRSIRVLSDLTVTAGQDISYKSIESDSWKVLTLDPGAISVYTDFVQVSLYGVLSGEWNVLVDCWVYTVTNFLGWMRGGSFETITLAEYIDPDPISFGSSYFDDIVPMYANTPAILNVAGGTKITFTGCTEIVHVNDTNASNVAVFSLAGGSIIIDASCLGGAIIIAGTGTPPVNNSLLDIDVSGLNNENTAWGAIAADNNISGTMGNKLNTASTGGVDLNALAVAVWDKTVESGNSAEEILKILASVLAGKVSGAGTGTETFKGIDGTTNRVVSTVDDDGNRSEVLLNVT